MGLCPSTDQCIVHDVEQSVLRFARIIMSSPDELKWNMMSIELVLVIPFEQHAAHDSEVAFPDRQ